MEAVIKYNEPAKKWSQGCMLGNGFMGEVIYGGIDKETIDLSESTFFSGAKEVDVYQENAAEYFEQMRKEAIKQNHAAVKELTKQFMGKRGNYGTNLPVGQLIIQFDNHGFTGRYKRQLNLNTGIYETQYENEEYLTVREAFSSYPDRVFCYRILNDTKEGINFSLSFKGKEESSQVFIQENRMCFTCKALEQLHSDGTKGVSLLGVIHVSLADGEVIYHKNYIEVKKTHKAVVFLVMETDFSLETKKNVLDFDALYTASNFKYEDYETLKVKHVLDFERYMKRQYIQIPQDKTTSLMHQFGRYLLLSSSREKSKLPAHLQGVWNDNVACNIGWTCDMHLDINTQMNYWISEAGNLSESHKPIFLWLEKSVIPNGRQSAQAYYGRKGWIGELVSNAYGYAAPYWNESLSPCPASGIWMASDYMEHYRFTGDTEFLQNHVYPVLREAVIFFCDYLFENEDGYYVAGPSISPENVFMIDGEKYYASIGCTFEILMIRELFTDFMEAVKILNKEDDMSCFIKRALPKLLPYQLDEQGLIKEWNHKYHAQDLQHRHTSHMLGLFPYHQINPKDTPLLAVAAQKTIEAKLKPYENWEDTGWARNLLILYYARLHNKEMAYKNLKELQQNLTNQGLLVMHPPTRGAYSFTDVYELDGNTGFSMAVIEMLIQCFHDEIELLPAVPKEWKVGSAKGISIRGGICIDLEWDMSTQITIELYSKVNKTVSIKYMNFSKTVELKENKKEKIIVTV